MDLISSRTIEISTLALDGLAERHKVLSANVANAQTANYTRSDVQFEDQLKQILNKENLKEGLKVANSNPEYKSPMQVNYNSIPGSVSEEAILKNNNYTDFKPNIVADQESPEIANGNNVNIESEMIELSKNGTKYTILAELQGKRLKETESIMKESNV
jgi:flagellar basal-body rod protein FlgB